MLERESDVGGAAEGAQFMLFSGSPEEAAAGVRVLLGYGAARDANATNASVATRNTAYAALIQFRPSNIDE